MTGKSTTPDGLQDGHSIILRSGTVPVSKLRMYHRNARQGDVDGIVESLRVNGQYRRLIVNVGTHTGRRDEILAGNHTYLGIRKLGWTKADVDWVDVDEEHAAKINAVDNRSHDKGGYDDAVLAAVLRDLDDYEGTGFTDEEAADILANAPVPQVDDLDLTAGDLGRMLDEGAPVDFADQPLGQEDEPDDDVGTLADGVSGGDAEEDTGAGDEIGEAAETLRGARTLKSPWEMDFGAGQSFWELPELRRDMLMSLSDLPPAGELYAWCGPVTKQWAPETSWWLYLWGVDQTAAMPDVSKVVVGFYTFDDRFENWWWYPAKYMAKVLNSGIKLMLMPDFSEDHPRIDALWSFYRSLFLARYFQECGCKVAPNLTWLSQDEQFLRQVVIPNLPKNAPLLAVQRQTYGANGQVDQDIVDADNRLFQIALDELQPAALLIYAGRTGRDEFADGRIRYSGTIYHVESRTSAIYEHQRKVGRPRRKRTI